MRRGRRCRRGREQRRRPARSVGCSRDGVTVRGVGERVAVSASGEFPGNVLVGDARMSGSDAGDRELFDGVRHLDAPLEPLSGAHRPQSSDDQRTNLVGRVDGSSGGRHTTQVTDRRNGAAPSGAAGYVNDRCGPVVARRRSRLHPRDGRHLRLAPRRRSRTVHRPETRLHRCGQSVMAPPTMARRWSISVSTAALSTADPASGPSGSSFSMSARRRCSVPT